MYRILFKTVIFGAIWIVAVSVVSVFICWFNHGHFDAKYVYHPFRLEWDFWKLFRTKWDSINTHVQINRLIFSYRLPWDNSTLIGFVAEICSILNCYHSYNIVNGSTMLLFISICLHHQAFFKMVQHSISKIDRNVHRQNYDQLLCELIHFHTSAKKLDEMLTNVLYRNYSILCSFQVFLGFSENVQLLSSSQPY